MHYWYIRLLNYTNSTILVDMKLFFSFDWWIMKLLQVISSENQPVRWTTPLGLPVVQPYRKSERHLVSVTAYLYPYKQTLPFTKHLVDG